MLAVLLAAPFLGLDNFAVAVALGLRGRARPVRCPLLLIFGGLAAAAVLVGGLVGAASAAWLGPVAQYAGGLVLVGLGAYQLWPRSTTDEAPAGDGAIPSVRSLWLIGLGVSLDTVLAGVAFGLRGDPLLASAAIVGLVTAGLSLVGLELGAHGAGWLVPRDPRVTPAALILVGVGLLSGLL